MSYTIDGIQYDSCFPIEWAENHKTFGDEYGGVYPSGPVYCSNCLFYGSFNGVFVGYCFNCAMAYDYERGKGFCFDFSEKEMWESLDYMKGVYFNAIGDFEERPELFNYPDSDEYLHIREKPLKKRGEKPLKRGEKRRIRRELRIRKNNEEYEGMPKESSHESDELYTYHESSLHEIYTLLLVIILYFIFIGLVYFK